MSWFNIWGELRLTITSGRKWFRKWLCFLTTSTINQRPFKSWKYICQQSTKLVSILYFCNGFSRYAYLLYAFPRYAFLCYAYLRYGFSRYAFCVMSICVMPICVMSFRVMPFRVMPFCVMPFHVTLFRVMPFRVMLFYAFYNSVCLSAFWLAVWYLKRVFALQLRFDAFQIWNKESACYYSALDWCIPDLKHRIGLLLFSFGLMHEQFG